jgi:hypothetical protein
MSLFDLAFEVTFHQYLRRAQHCLLKASDVFDTDRQRAVEPSKRHIPWTRSGAFQDFFTCPLNSSKASACPFREQSQLLT